MRLGVDGTSFLAEASGGQDTTRRVAKKLKTAKQKLTESFRSAALKEFYREKYKNNRRINKSKFCLGDQSAFCTSSNISVCFEIVLGVGDL